MRRNADGQKRSRGLCSGPKVTTRNRWWTVREERTQLPWLKQQLNALPSLQRHHCCDFGSLAPPKCSLKDVKTGVQRSSLCRPSARVPANSEVSQADSLRLRQTNPTETPSFSPRIHREKLKLWQHSERRNSHEKGERIQVKPLRSERGSQPVPRP